MSERLTWESPRYLWYSNANAVLDNVQRRPYQARVYLFAHIGSGIKWHARLKNLRLEVVPLPVTMFSKAFKSIVVLALAVAANGAAIQKAPVKLSLSRHFNLTGTKNILEHDQARARQLKARGSNLESLSVNEPVTNQAVIYTASVGIGSPATDRGYLLWGARTVLILGNRYSYSWHWKVRLLWTNVRWSYETNFDLAQTHGSVQSLPTHKPAPAIKQKIQWYVDLDHSRDQGNVQISFSVLSMVPGLFVVSASAYVYFFTWLFSRNRMARPSDARLQLDYHKSIHWCRINCECVNNQGMNLLTWSFSRADLLLTTVSWG